MRAPEGGDDRAVVLSLRNAIVAAGCATVLAACGGGERGGAGVASEAETSAPAAAEPSSADGGRYVDVGGYRLFLRCTGKGTPTVVLEAGAGLDSSDWQEVQPKVAELAHVCSYDRAGLGRSDDAPEGKDEFGPGDDAPPEQLHVLLEKAGLEPPFVLTGHSMGGLYVRLYERKYPGEAAGMVLVDSVDGSARVSLGARPLIVLTQSRPRDDPLLREQKQLAAFSSNSSLVVATKSGHFIEHDQPALIVEAVRQVLRAARSHSRLPACEATFPRIGGSCPGG